MDYADKLDMMDDDCDIQGFPLDDSKDIRVPTNADHIRSMTDEELYVFLSGINFDECECPARDVCAKTNSCANGFVDWLKQPYEEDKL